VTGIDNALKSITIAGCSLDSRRRQTGSRALGMAKARAACALLTRGVDLALAGGHAQIGLDGRSSACSSVSAWDKGALEVMPPGGEPQRPTSLQWTAHMVRHPFNRCPKSRVQ
jgi:hypothetical protein